MIPNQPVIPTKEEIVRNHASHSVVCNAPAATVHDLISRTSEWPRLLGPCEAVTVLESDGPTELVEITARLQGVGMSWQSRRTVRPEVLGVDAELVRPMPLVASMRTTWRVVAVNDEQCVLLLEHDYRLCDDITGLVDGVHTRAEAARFIAASIDVNSERELADFKAAAERAGAPSGRDRALRHSIVCAAPADEVYAVVRNAANWPLIFDACVAATRVGGDDTTELVRIDALQDGATISWETRRHYTDAIRRIEYELPVPMPFLESMSGQWRVIPLTADRCLLTVDRRWRLLADVTGIRPGVNTVDQAAEVVDGFVDGNAEAEMLAIRDFAENRSAALATVVVRATLPHPPDEVLAALFPLVGTADLLTGRPAGTVRYQDAVHDELVAQPRGEAALRVVRTRDERSLSIDVCQPGPPRGIAARWGRWRVRATPGGSEVVARQSARVDAGALAAAADRADVPEKKRRLRELLERDSRATLDACARALVEPPPARPRLDAAQAGEAVLEAAGV